MPALAEWYSSIYELGWKHAHLPESATLCRCAIALV